MRSWKSKWPPPASTHIVSGDFGFRLRKSSALAARPLASSYSPLKNSSGTPSSSRPRACGPCVRRGSPASAPCRDRRERATRVPDREMVRVARHRRVADRHDRRELQLARTPIRRPSAAIICSNCSPAPSSKRKSAVERRRHPHLGEADLRQHLPHRGMLEDALLEHVVLADDDAADPFAVRRDPEERPRVAAGDLVGSDRRHLGRPLPLGRVRGTALARHSSQKERFESRSSLRHVARPPSRSGQSKGSRSSAAERPRRPSSESVLPVTRSLACGG